jgi:hypothetical protein
MLRSRTTQCSHYDSQGRFYLKHQECRLAWSGTASYGQSATRHPSEAGYHMFYRSTPVSQRLLHQDDGTHVFMIEPVMNLELQLR